MKVMNLSFQWPKVTSMVNCVCRATMKQVSEVTQTLSGLVIRSLEDLEIYETPLALLCGTPELWNLCSMMCQSNGSTTSLFNGIGLTLYTDK